jgi:hypothetical protein
MSGIPLVTGATLSLALYLTLALVEAAREQRVRFSRPGMRGVTAVSPVAFPDA